MLGSSRGLLLGSGEDDPSGPGSGAGRVCPRLPEAHHTDRLRRRLPIYLKPRLLIIDEVGCLALGPLDAANLLRLVQERYQRGGAMIVT